MGKILLDYVFPISVITPTAQASTGFLKQVGIVVKPKTGQTGNVGNVYACVTMTEVLARTDNTNAQQLFTAGMSRVYVILADDLDLATTLEANKNLFWTLLISDDFDADDMTDAQASGTSTVTSFANLVSGTADKVTLAGIEFTAQAGVVTPGGATFQAATSNNATATSLAAQINAHTTTSALVTAVAVGAVVTITAKLAGVAGNDITLTYTDGDANVGITLGGLSAGKLSGGAGSQFGTFDGVVGISSDDTDFVKLQAAIENRTGFYVAPANGAKNMFFAFGKLLSNLVNWTNQQYVSMPVNDGIDMLGEANDLFDSKVSFVINDDEFGNRLALLAAGGKAIAAPYILKNMRIDLQSRAVQWISANQPSYTLTNASLLETRLQEDVIVTKYIATNWITAGTVEITLVQDNFVANGAINVAEPGALWRVFSEMRATL